MRIVSRLFSRITTKCTQHLIGILTHVLVFFAFLGVCVEIKQFYLAKKMPFNYKIKSSFFSKNYIINCPPCLLDKPCLCIEILVDDAVLWLTSVAQMD